MRVLVTGVAGFIGYHVAQALLARGLEVVGADDLNTYYDVRLKRARLARLGGKGFSFHKLDIADHDSVMKLGDGVEVIVHVAAQAGVRYSLEQPFAYAASNLTGHLSILELARHAPGVKHLIYASSSSVYGTGSALPYAESERADKPSSLYAATKRADELMSASYTHLFGLRQTGLRFFYRVWALGTAGYGVFRVCRGDLRGPAGDTVRFGAAEAGFHLYRRYRGRDSGGVRQPAGQRGAASRVQYRQ